MSRRISSAGLVLSAALLLHACRSAPVAETGSPAPPQPATPIEVRHNVRTALSLTIYLVTPSGISRRLGTVSAGQTVRLTYDEVPSSGPHRLVAETPDGRSVVSQSFDFGPRLGVSWDLDANIITILRDGAG